MRIITLILTLIAFGTIAFNISVLNFKDVLQGDSFVAVVTIVLSLCAIVLLQILRISKRIEKLSKEKKNV